MWAKPAALQQRQEHQGHQQVRLARRGQRLQRLTKALRHRRYLAVLPRPHLFWVIGHNLPALRQRNKLKKMRKAWLTR
jgi:hypothetical protein